MEFPSVKYVIGFIVALLLIGVLAPIGLADILEFSSTDATVELLVTTVLPIMVVVGLMLAFIPRGE